MTKATQPGRKEAVSPPASTRPKRLDLSQLGGVGQAIANGWRDMHSRPLTNYYLILFFAACLAGLGILMVFSSSMTWSVVEGNSVWATALRQLVMVVLGVVGMLVAMRIKPGTVRKMAPYLLVVAFAFLIAVLIPGIGTGKEEVGSQSWIDLGPLRFQPSEFAKVALAVWGASYLGARTEPVANGQESESNRLAVYGVVSALMLGLIAAEGDLGMAATVFLIVALIGIIAGVKFQWVVGIAVAIGAGVIFKAMSGGGYRGDRITVWFDALMGRFDDTRGAAFQSYQGFLSLSDGSLFGVGIGQSRAKWFYLPEAKNDFVFAIVGEELGWVGAMVVIAFFAGLAVYGIRVAINARDPFISLMAGALTMGVVGQAFVNIGYVVGLFPVTGIQLPLISAGGTSAVITLTSMGLLASCARYEPEAISAMQSYGRPTIDRLLRLPEPSENDLIASQARTKRAPKVATAVPVTSQRPASRMDGRERRLAGQRGAVPRTEATRRGGSFEGNEPGVRRQAPGAGSSRDGDRVSGRAKGQQRRPRRNR
ncbi:FtsW/RodA/SpoVE family cell cycle protein [Staphylococcus chromogenes]|nr:FtsW/RodA/SpoVE family cell cycle protein [Staphylococcus chromogenes]